MGGKQKIAEKNRIIVKALKNGDARAVVDAQGRGKVKLSAPNVDKKKVRRSILGTRIFYTCPKCGKPLEYRKKLHRNLCMRCGQYLDWSGCDDIQCVWLKVENAEEAGYWAGQYEILNGTLYGIDFETWRLSMTRSQYPALLYFAFPEGKAYGRFMRKAAVEGTVVKSF